MTIKLLTFTTLYPDSTRPNHGIFVENRLLHLLAGGRVESRVVAPVPWFPFRTTCFRKYANFARVPEQEIRNGIEVVHPRYPSIPKAGMAAAPWLLASAMRIVLRRILDNGFDFDIIDAHYFYPDGVAAVMLGRMFEKPVVVTGRGSDLNLILDFYFPRKMMLWAASHAKAIITVSRALKDKLMQFPIPESKVTVLRNGVDLTLFRPPEDRQSLRKKIGINAETRILLSVGNLVPLKGHDLVIRSLAQLPGVCLMIAGGGLEEQHLRELARTLGLSDRVHFLGVVEQAKLVDYYGACDALVLASSHEGSPNVLLESLACGTPVVVTAIPGCREIVTRPEAGLLAEIRSADCFAREISRLLSALPSPASVRHFAEQFSWDATTRGQEEIFFRIAGTSQSTEQVGP